MADPNTPTVGITPLAPGETRINGVVVKTPTPPAAPPAQNSQGTPGPSTPAGQAFTGQNGPPNLPGTPGYNPELGTSTPMPVVTANAATTDYNNKSAAFNAINSAVADQATKVATNNAAADTTTPPADTNTNTLSEVQKLLSDNPNADPYSLGLTDQPPANSSQTYDNSAPPAGYKYMYDANGNRVSVVDNPSQGEINSEVTDNNAQLQTAFDNLNNSVTQLQNGTLPLTPAQQAQVNALQQQFQQLEDQQKLTNQNYEGGVTNAAISSGRQRYAPEIALGQIQQAVSDGIQKIADIETKATAAISKLTEGFQTQDYNQINAAYKDLQTAITDKNTALTKLSTDITNATKAAITEQQKQVAQDQAQQKINNSVTAAAQKFAAAHNIQTPFYMIAGTAFDSKTGQPVTYDQYIAAGGDPKFGPDSVTQVQTKGDTYQINSKIVLNGQTHNVRQTYDAKGNMVNQVDEGVVGATPKSSNSTTSKPKPAGAPPADKLNAAMNNLKSQAGTDGAVSPDIWNQALDQWTKAGFSEASFKSNFGSFAKNSKSSAINNYNGM
jgi:hypothetical protein